MKISVIGLPGSGKSTLCGFLCNKFKLPLIGCTKSDFKRADFKDEIKATLNNPALNNGYVLDGIVCDKQFAEDLFNNNKIDLCLYINATLLQSYTGVAGRRLDPDTHTIYHVFFAKPKSDEITKRLVLTDDDKKITDIFEYVKQYKSKIDEICEFFKTKNKLLTVPYNNSIDRFTDSVFAQIQKIKEGI